MNKKVLLNLIKNDTIRKYEHHKDRIKHIEGVCQVGMKLATHYGFDPIDMAICAWIHDYTKYDSFDEQAKYLSKKDISKYKNTKEMYHAISAANYLKKVYLIKDKHILNAIRSHMYGDERFDKFTMIMILADKIEPSRNYPGVDQLRKLAYQDLNLAYSQFIKEHIQHLKQKNIEINDELNSIFTQIQRGTDI